jgi:GNAT superfamily N-acetyltransferase
VTAPRVRPALAADVPAAAAAVGRLLDELGGSRPAAAELEAEAAALAGDASPGCLLVAGAGGPLLGVLAATRLRAMHVPGPYAVIQDLWVDPAWRSRGLGAALVEAAAEWARARGISRLEVGLPGEDFAAIAATEAFYRRNGFEPLGPRMRRSLP